MSPVRAGRAAGVSPAFGPRLRALRAARHMTLDVLATVTKLHKGYLSRVERGQKSPSLAACLRIGDALDVSVGELFGEQIAEHAVRVLRRSERVRVAGVGSSAFEVLTRTGAALDAFVVYPLAEFASPSDGAEHPGEELLLVLSGVIEMRFADRCVLLDEGDCAQFPGHLAHRLRRVGDALAVALVAVTRASPAL